MADVRLAGQINLTLTRNDPSAAAIASQVVLTLTRRNLATASIASQVVLTLTTQPQEAQIASMVVLALVRAPAVIPPVEQEFPPDSDISGQTIGLTWIEFLDRAGGAHVSSKVELPDPDSFYHGWKDGDIIEWGKVRRALSDSRGQYEATSFTWRLSDAARKWRGMLAAAATKIFLNRSVVMRMISDEERRKWHHDPPLD